MISNDTPDEAICDWCGGSGGWPRMGDGDDQGCSRCGGTGVIEDGDGES